MTARATHWHAATQSAVFPDGYADDGIEKLPKSFWLDRDRQTAIAAVKAEAASRIEAVGFPAYAQLNAIREGRLNDPRFAEIDAIRRWSNDEEAKLK